MTGKCIWCGSDLIYEADSTSEEFFGPCGDPNEDNRWVSSAHCIGCGASVIFISPAKDD